MSFSFTNPSKKKSNYTRPNNSINTRNGTTATVTNASDIGPTLKNIVPVPASLQGYLNNTKSNTKPSYSNGNNKNQIQMPSEVINSVPDGAVRALVYNREDSDAIGKSQSESFQQSQSNSNSVTVTVSEVAPKPGQSQQPQLTNKTQTVTPRQQKFRKERAKDDMEKLREQHRQMIETRQMFDNEINEIKNSNNNDVGPGLTLGQNLRTSSKESTSSGGSSELSSNVTIQDSGKSKSEQPFSLKKLAADVQQSKDSKESKTKLSTNSSTNKSSSVNQTTQQRTRMSSKISIPNSLLNPTEKELLEVIEKPLINSKDSDNHTPIATLRLPKVEEIQVVTNHDSNDSDHVNLNDQANNDDADDDPDPIFSPKRYKEKMEKILNNKSSTKDLVSDPESDPLENLEDQLQMDMNTSQMNKYKHVKKDYAQLVTDQDLSFSAPPVPIKTQKDVIGLGGNRGTKAAAKANLKTTNNKKSSDSGVTNTNSNRAGSELSDLLSWMEETEAFDEQRGVEELFESDESNVNLNSHGLNNLIKDYNLDVDLKEGEDDTGTSGTQPLDSARVSNINSSTVTNRKSVSNNINNTSTVTSSNVTPRVKGETQQSQILGKADADVSFDKFEANVNDDDGQSLKLYNDLNAQYESQLAATTILVSQNAIAAVSAAASTAGPSQSLQSQSNPKPQRLLVVKPFDKDKELSLISPLYTNRVCDIRKFGSSIAFSVKLVLEDHFDNVNQMSSDSQQQSVSNLGPSESANSNTTTTVTNLTNTNAHNYYTSNFNLGPQQTTKLNFVLKVFTDSYPTRRDSISLRIVQGQVLGQKSIGSSSYNSTTRDNGLCEQLRLLVTSSAWRKFQSIKVHDCFCAVVIDTLCSVLDHEKKLATDLVINLGITTQTTNTNSNLKLNDSEAGPIKSETVKTKIGQKSSTIKTAAMPIDDNIVGKFKLNSSSETVAVTETSESESNDNQKITDVRDRITSANFGGIEDLEKMDLSNIDLNDLKMALQLDSS